MSSIPSGVATPSRPAKKTEEVRNSLHKHLRKTAQFIKILDTLVILFGWVAAMLGVWLIACMVDHWLFPLPSFVRWLVWIAGVTGTVTWVSTRLIPLVVRRINPVYAARRIENLVPEFKNGLVSWLELESIPENGVPRGVMAALTYRAARFIGGQDPSATVDTSHLIKLIGGVLLLTTSLVVYTMISPKSTYVTGKRIVMPWASLASPTRVRILEVKPGEKELTQGKPLDVEVELRGLFLDEPVLAVFSTIDGQLADQRVRLNPASEGLRYTGQIKTTPDGVEHELDYWIEAGDARSRPFRVTLNPLPTVALEAITLEFPDYTRLEPRVVASGSEVEAVEGTLANISALANQPVTRGKLEVNPEIDAKGELVRAQAFIEMKADGRNLDGQILLRLNESKDNPSNVGFRIRGYNAVGDANPRAIVHSMSVFADIAPEITLLGPENRVIRATPKSQLMLEVRGNDPDFGLTKLMVEIRKNNLLLTEETLLDGEGAVGRQVKKLPLSLAGLDARIGDEYQILASALDNRHDPVSGEPSPNRTVSEPLLIQIVGPEEADADLNQNANPPTQPDTPPADAIEQPGAKDNNATEPQGTSQDPGDQGAERSPETATEGQSSQQDSENAGGENTDSQTSQSGQTGSQQSTSGESGEQTTGETSQQGSPAGGSSSSSSAEQNSQPSAGSQSSGSQSSGSQSSGSQSSGSESSPSAAGASQENNSNSSASNSGKPGQDAGGSGQSNSAEDREAIERVREYMESKQKDSSTNQSGGSQKPAQNGNDAATSEGDGNSSSKDNSRTDGSATKAKGSPASADGTKKDGDAGQTQQPQGSQPQGSQPQGSQPQGSQPQGSQPQGSQPQGSQPQGSQPQGSQPQGSQPQGSQPQGSQPQGSQPQGSQPQGSQPQGSQPQGSQQQGSQQQGSQPQGSQPQGSQPQGSQPQGSQQQGSQPQGSQPQGSQPQGSQPQGSQPQGSQPQGSQPQGSQPQGSQQQGSQQQGSQQQGSQQQGSQQQGSQQQGSQQQDSQQQGADPQSGAQKQPSEESSGSQSGSESSETQSGSKSDSQSGSQSQGSQSQGSGSQTGEQNESGSSDGQSASESSGDPTTAGNQPGSQSSNAASSSSPSNNPNKSGSTSSGGPPQSGQGVSGVEGDAADSAYAEKTTELVLDYLNRQRDQPDPELLKELNWTEGDFQNFLKRWNEARDLSLSDNEQDRLQWQQKLQDLGLTSRERKAISGSGINDAFRQQQDGGSRIRPPQSLGKQFEAFQKALQKLEP